MVWRRDDLLVGLLGRHMRKRFVRFDAIVTEEELPVFGSDERDRYVEIVVSGPGACRRHRMEDVVPDLAGALSDINSSILILAEMVQERKS